MTASSPDIGDPLAHHYLCHGCGAYLPKDVLCPRCHAVPDDATDDVVGTRDVVLSVLLAVVALVLTVPPTVMLVRVVFLRRGWLDAFFPVLLVSIWNGYLLGYPVLTLTRRWHHRIRHHHFGYSWIWGDYWRLQLQVLTPLLIIAIFPALLIVAYWLRFLFLP